MRVVFLLLGVAAVVAKNSSSSTGSDPAMASSSTGAANMSSTGADPMSSTGAANMSSTGADPMANMSSTGAVPMANMSSTGAVPMANMSSTGAANMSSTGASASTGMAPGQCSTLDSCGSCFSSGCVWCFTNGTNEFPCMNASATCNDVATDLPIPLSFINLTKYGSDACGFIDCIPALNANVKKLQDMQNVFSLNTTTRSNSSNTPWSNSTCMRDFLACEANVNKSSCKCNCPLSGADVETYKHSCNNLTMSSGSVCEYSYDGIISNKNNSKESVFVDRPLCVPDTCVSQSIWSEVFADAIAAWGTNYCSHIPPFECKVENVEVKCAGSGSGSGSTAGLSTGALIAIVLGSLVGVILLFFCGQKVYTGQKSKSEYQAMVNNN